jgi:hypothetical protein
VPDVAVSKIFLNESGIRIRSNKRRSRTTQKTEPPPSVVDAFNRGNYTTLTDPTAIPRPHTQIGKFDNFGSDVGRALLPLVPYAKKCSLIQTKLTTS